MMMNEAFVGLAAALPIVIPLAACLALAGLCFAGIRLREQYIERLVRVVMLVSCVAVLTLGYRVQGKEAVRLLYGSWFTSGHYRFDFELLIDRLSMTYLVMSSFIASIVGYFSARYLHRDPGFCRFFIWYLMFVGGLNLLVLASGFNLMIAGWEFVGLSSVFLVGFYNQRSGPTKNSLQVFTAYRIADIGLLGVAAIIHLWMGSERLPVWESTQTYPTSTLAIIGSFLALWAAMGKSAQGPFAFWLPRAMEGPTPSSAIFYGALSVHAGAYLLLRMAPAWEGLLCVRVALFLVGSATALYGAFVGRACCDVKSLLANASLAQVGLIFAEIGIGFYHFALWHIVGHAMLRTLQFLCAPSAISDWRVLQLHTNSTVSARMITRVGGLLPRSVAIWLYRQSLDALNLESALHQYVVDPAMQLARFLNFSERELAAALDESSDIYPDGGEPASDDILSHVKVGDA